MRFGGFTCLVILLWASSSLYDSDAHRVQPLSRIAIHEATFNLHAEAYVKASPRVLGLQGQNNEWVTLKYSIPNPSVDHWIGVFSPANFSAGICESENPRVGPPYLCTAPIKFQYANDSSPSYKTTGNGTLKLRLIDKASLGPCKLIFIISSLLAYYGLVWRQVRVEPKGVVMATCCSCKIMKRKDNWGLWK